MIVWRELWRPLVIAVLCLVGIGAIRKTGHRRVPGIDPLKYYDNRTIAILTGATRTQVWRLEEGPVTMIKPLLHDRYTIAYEGPAQGPQFTLRLRQRLLEPATYGGFNVACFSPGVAFRLWNRKQSATAYICFHCNNMLVEEDSPEAKHRDEQRLNPEARNILLRMAQEALPQDKTIQSLRDE